MINSIRGEMDKMDVSFINYQDDVVPRDYSVHVGYHAYEDINSRWS